MFDLLLHRRAADYRLVSRAMGAVRRGRACLQGASIHKELYEEKWHGMCATVHEGRTLDLLAFLRVNEQSLPVLV